MMKRSLIGGILIVTLSMCPSITAQANSLSTIPTEEQTGIPEEIYQDAEIIGHQYDICPELLMALAERESCFTPTVENGSCKGLMQVNASCHRDRFSKQGWSYTEWKDPYKNMYVAADYLHELFEKYEDVGIVLGLYHGESNAISRAKRGQLSSYVTKILERSEQLERLHGK